MMPETLGIVAVGLALVTLIVLAYQKDWPDFRAAGPKCRQSSSGAYTAAARPAPTPRGRPAMAAGTEKCIAYSERRGGFDVAFYV